MTVRGEGEIVFVDDDEIEILIARKNHARSRLRNALLTFQSGPAFLAHMDEVKALRRQTPELVLLDLRMPEMDGIAVIERLRADPQFAEAPAIVVFSNSNNESDRERSVQVGADAYWVKPNSAEEYVAMFDRLAAPG